MDKYLDELNELLVDLDSNDRSDAIEYYKNYIVDAHLDTYENIVNQLGSALSLSVMIKKSQDNRYDDEIEIGTKKVYSVKNEVRSTRDDKNIVTNNFLWCILLGIIVVMVLNTFIGVGIFLFALYLVYYFMIKNRR